MPAQEHVGGHHGCVAMADRPVPGDSQFGSTRHVMRDAATDSVPELPDKLNEDSERRELDVTL